MVIDHAEPVMLAEVIEALKFDPPPPLSVNISVDNEDIVKSSVKSPAVIVTADAALT